MKTVRIMTLLTWQITRVRSWMTMIYLNRTTNSLANPMYLITKFKSSNMPVQLQKEVNGNGVDLKKSKCKKKKKSLKRRVSFVLID